MVDVDMQGELKPLEWLMVDINRSKRFNSPCISDFVTSTMAWHAIQASSLIRAFGQYCEPESNHNISRLAASAKAKRVPGDHHPLADLIRPTTTPAAQSSAAR